MFIMNAKTTSKSPAGKKRDYTTWNSVDDDLLIPNKSMVAFNKACQTMGRQKVVEELLDGYSLGCGFCYRQQFYAKVTLIKQQDRLEIPSSIRSDAIYVNPATMKICKLVLAGPVVIQARCNTDNVSVGIAWPSESIPPDCIAIHPEMMSSMKLQIQELACLKPAAKSVIYASEIAIKPIFDHDDILNSQSLLYGDTKQHLDGKYFLPGNRFHIWLNGKSYQYEVSYLQGIHGRIQLREQATDLDLVNTKISNITVSVKEGKKGGQRKLLHNTIYSFDFIISIYLAIFITYLINNSQLLEPSVIQNSKLTVVNGDAVTKYDAMDHFLYVINIEHTQLRFIGMTDMSCQTDKLVTFNEVGGLKKQIRMIKEIVDFTTISGDHGSSLGIMNGILLHGPSGVGKTLVAEAAANESGNTSFHINGPEIFSRLYGESEAKLRRIFDDAVHRAPSIIIVDELDTICPKRSYTQNEVEKRIVATFASLLDRISKSSGSERVVVIASTNRIDAIDTALRRPGRFDREIEISIPSIDDRKEILQKILANVQHTLSDQTLTSIADSTHGFVGADMLSLCKEAAVLSMKRNTSLQLKDFEGELRISLQPSDFLSAITKIKPSAMREVAVEVPKVLWTDIGGQQEIKQRLKESVEWPIKHPSTFRRLGVKPPKGILLYGPPGCSKTMIAKALATESGLNFLAVKGPELFNKWVGESEKAVRELFRKARAASPSIIFFDEIDALAAQRGSDGAGVGDRVLTQLLTELDGIEQLEDVTIVAATNRPEMIDKALLRPGRIDRILYVPLPDSETRHEILKIQFRRIPVNDDVDIEYLTLKTEGFSGAEVALLCQEAAFAALQENIECERVCRQHFINALNMVVPRTSQAAITQYKSYYQQSGLYMI
ncbi:Spermatogenesis-associated protein 5 [Trichoplax sp. H2]|nr:Spermatogenesis-associated protein 5 [Trichoplax sp. H2]|eukprot:RDD36861.1 Spermatogenesis-associated protein 5 [Trichoplax sp. H2]